MEMVEKRAPSPSPSNAKGVDVVLSLWSDVRVKLLEWAADSAPEPSPNNLNYSQSLLRRYLSGSPPARNHVKSPLEVVKTVDFSVGVEEASRSPGAAEDQAGGVGLWRMADVIEEARSCCEEPSPVEEMVQRMNAKGVGVRPLARPPLLSDLSRTELLWPHRGPGTAVDHRWAAVTAQLCDWAYCPSPAVVPIVSHVRGFTVMVRVELNGSRQAYEEVEPFATLYLELRGKEAKVAMFPGVPGASEGCAGAEVEVVLSSERVYAVEEVEEEEEEAAHGHGRGAEEERRAAPLGPASGASPKQSRPPSQKKLPLFLS